MTKKKELTTPAAGLPELGVDLSDYADEGFEGADLSAYAVPFLRILQSNNPQVNEDDEAYVEGAKAGMFFNTISCELYGRELDIIPISYARDFVEWKPNRAGFVKAHGPDPAILDRIVEIDEKNNSILDTGNIIQDTRNHYVLLADHLEAGPIIFSLVSTGIRHSRKWMTLMRNIKIPNTGKTAPMFSTIWTVRTVHNKNDDGSWYQIGDKTKTAVEFKDWVNKEQFKASMAARDLIKSATVNYASDIPPEDKDDVPF